MMFIQFYNIEGDWWVKKKLNFLHLAKYAKLVKYLSEDIAHQICGDKFNFHYMQWHQFNDIVSLNSTAVEKT